MLARLRVKNLAIIREAEVRFTAGLNVITGETGAGKSILMDALGLLTGGRAHRDMIRTGEDELRVDGRFQVEETAGLRAELSGLGLDLRGGVLEITRSFTGSGRGRVRVNGRPCPLAALRKLGERLVTIHGQHDHRLLLESELHRDLLDAFGRMGRAVALCRERHGEMEALESRLRARRMDARERARRIDFLRFQLEEIAALRPRPNEDLELREEKNLLAHAEEIARLSRESWERLQDGDENILSGLAGVERNLERLGEIDDGAAELAGRCASLRLELEDVAGSLSDYTRRVEFDPQRLGQVEERLVQLEGLKRKYGPELTDVLAHVAESRAELAELEGAESEAEGLEAAVAEAAGRFTEAALALSRKRRTAAGRLAGAMERELAGLAMENAVFQPRLEAEPAEGSRVMVDGRPVRHDSGGVDRVEFLISPNPGEEPRPLARIASGGELSRIMLALSSVIRSQRDAGRLLVFDEVDSGIGGRVARVVGKKLKSIAGKNQVICITHLPQICSAADHHLSVRKEEAGGRTEVRVDRLEGEARLREVARMLGGEEKVSPQVLASARRLMADARS